MSSVVEEPAALSPASQPSQPSQPSQLQQSPQSQTLQTLSQALAQAPQAAHDEFFSAELPLKLQFQEDSPQFAAGVASAGQELDQLGEYLRLLTRQMRQFCKDALVTARQADSLANHMKQGPRMTQTKPHERKLKQVIQTFGNALAEIAAAQEIMVESLGMTFIEPIERFYQEDIAQAMTLRKRYFHNRDAYVGAVSRYLQSSTGSFGKTPQSLLEKRAYEVAHRRRKFETQRFELVCTMNELEVRKSFELAECCVASLYSLRTFHHQCLDCVNTSGDFLDAVRSANQAERQMFEERSKPWMQQRADIANVLCTMVERVETQSIQFTAQDFAPSEEVYEDTNSSVVSPVTVASAGGDGAGSTTSDDSPVHPATQPESITMANVSSAIQQRVGGAFARLTTTLSNANNTFRRTMQMQAADADATQGDGQQQTWNCEECERRVKALDREDLKPHFTLLNHADVVVEGFLWKRTSSSMVQHWNRRWFILTGSQLKYVSPESGVQAVCDILLASVRDVSTSDLPFCFELTYANRRTYTLQAEGHKEFEMWTNGIKRSIEQALSSVIHDSSSSGHSPKRSGGRASQGSASSAQFVTSLMAANPSCADCGQANPNWVSLNLGVLICITCSGAHRSMGVHVSKVRSLTLDVLATEDYELLAAIGNEKANTVWEGTLNDQSGWQKPQPGDEAAVKDKFIKAKYQWKGFIVQHPDQDPNDGLMQAVTANDLLGVIAELARGADVQTSSTDNDNKTALHLAAELGNTLICTLLVENGAYLTAMDKQQCTPMDYAMLNHHMATAEYLSRKVESTMQFRSNSLVDSPLDSPRETRISF